jgi:hypothetical protein
MQNPVEHTEVDAKEWLLDKLNEVKKILYGEKCYPFTMKHLNYHAYSKNNPKRYFLFQIKKKKAGEFRNISAPNPGLKCIQRCINVLLLEHFTPHPSATGFVCEKSIVDNARVHLGQSFIYNIDLKDFFPSIKAGRVFVRLQTPPFLFDKQTASLITDLCCHNGALPQGAPTSPTLTNIICERLDWRLSKLAQRYGLHYSRYADDITFSGMINVFHDDGHFIGELRHYISKEGFVINDDKTRLRSLYQRQEVTGLTINKKPNVTQKYVKQIRAMLNNWEKGGYDYAQTKFLELYHPQKHVQNRHYIENVISGKLDYLKMVKGATDSTYLSLTNRFQVLLGSIDGTKDEKRVLKALEELNKLLE